MVQTFWKRGGSTLAAVSRQGVLGLLAYVGLDLLKLAFERSGLIHLLYIFLCSPLFLSVWFCFSISSGHLIVGFDLASLSSLFSLFTVHVTFVRDSKRERTGRKKLKMAEEMAAPASGAPPAATDHEFTSHQEGPAPVPLNNASRRSTLSKRYGGHCSGELLRVFLQPAISVQEALRRAVLMKRTGRTPRYGRPLETAVFPAIAWQCYAEDDTAAVPCRRLGDMYYLHFEIR